MRTQKEGDRTRGTKNETGTYKCIGSHAREETHFECPLRGSPIDLPVLGSQSLTYVIIRLKREEEGKQGGYSSTTSRERIEVRYGVR